MLEGKKFEPVDLGSLKTYSIADRKSKVSAEDLAKPWKTGGLFSSFLERLPRILAARQLGEVVDALAKAALNDKTIMLAMGAHVIKVGLSPVLIDLMRRKIVTALAFNGAGIIHDFELAYAGKTSEDVAASLGSGDFGMAAETGELLGEAVRRAEEESTGLGKAVGRMILDKKLPYADASLLATAAELDIPATVHVAFGTDIVHMHPGFDPAKAGAATHLDFRIFASVVSTLEQGVYMNVGSAVLLPEVFLKAITLARNLGHRVDEFTTVNLDFIRHYRPLTNVVNRPTSSGGKGYHLTGCHEIMLPLIAAGLLEKMEDARTS